MSSLRWRLLIAAAWLTCSGCNGGSDVGLPDEPLPSGSLTGGIGGKGGGAGAAAGKAGTAGVGGKGGVGAKGGAGGGSGSPGAAGAGGTVPDWLADPAIWKKFESPSGDASTGCPLFVATTGIELRPLEWTPCGAGCESTSPTTLYPSARMVPSTSLVNGVAETFANVVEATNYGLPTTSLMYWRNLRTGDVHGAVRRFAATTADGTCTVANAWGNDPRFGHFRDALYSARWDAGFVLKVSPSLPAGFLQAVSGSWGMSERDTLFFTGGKLVGYPVDKPSSVLESPSDARRGDADGNMAVFVAQPRLRGYVDDGKAGIQTLVETMPSYPHHAAVSPTRVVALLGDESFPGSDSGSFSALRLWHGPRSLEDLSSKGELVELPFHPPGDGTLAPDEIKTWGDWAATKVGWYDAKGLPKTTYLVAHLPGKKSWAVLPIPGYQFERFYTLDDTHSYINGTAVTAPYASRMWRISLADLDAFTAGQTPL